MTEQWDADINVNVTLAIQLIESQFPQFVPITIHKLGEGWDNEVYRVNAQFVFRFPRRSVAVDCMRHETQVLPAIAPKLPVPVSCPLYVGHPTEAYPHPFAGYPYLSGSPVHAAGRTDAVRTRCASDLGNFLRVLHRTPWHDAAMAKLPGDSTMRMSVARRVPKLQDYLHQLRQRGIVEDLEPCMKIMEEARAAEHEPTEPTLVHGDLNFRNFLLDDGGRLSAVIDWGDIHFGNPAVDLAVMHSFLPPEARDAFENAYGPVSDHLRRLSRFRALYTSAYILLYARDIHDIEQEREATASLRRILA